MHPVDAVDSPTRDRRLVLPLALGLLALSLLLLYAGHYLHLDDTSGFGGNEWNQPLGFLALLAVLGAIGVSLLDRRARQAVGGALLLLDAVVFFWAGADDGFRFIWADDEGELVLLQLTLVLVGLALMTPSFRMPVDAPLGRDGPVRGRLTGWARTVIYLAALVVVPLVALSLGISTFEATQCAGSDGDCDLGFLAGLVWATIAVVLVVVGIVANEVALLVRRRRHRAASAT